MELNDIIKACQQNSRQAQQKLFELYQAKLFAVCLKYAATYDDAQDGFQDGFIQIFKTISQYSGKGSFEGWLKRVMVTTILQQYRMKKLQLVSDDNISEKLPEEEEVLLDYPDELLDMHYLTQLIQGLPDKYRLVFSMYVLDGFTHKEISEMLGISEGTSKSNLSRAKQLLKERIESNRTALLKNAKE